MISDLAAAISGDAVYTDNLTTVNRLPDSCCLTCLVEVLNLLDAKTELIRNGITADFKNVSAVWILHANRLYFVQMGTGDLNRDIAEVHAKIEGSIKILTDWGKHLLGDNSAEFFSSKEKVITFLLFTPINVIDELITSIENMPSLFVMKKDNVMGEIKPKTCDEFDDMVQNILGLTA